MPWQKKKNCVEFFFLQLSKVKGMRTYMKLVGLKKKSVTILITRVQQQTPQDQ